MIVTPKSDAKAVTDGWLNAGATYVVLFIQTCRQNLLIWSDNENTAVLFPLSEFDVIDTSIPPNWVVSVDLTGSLVLGPERWMEDDFWDRYNEEEAAAIELFEEERARMM